MADAAFAGPAGVLADELRRRFRLEEFSDFLLYERGLARSTVRAYLADCGSLVAYVSQRGIGQPEAVGYDDLRAHLADLGDRGLG